MSASPLMLAIVFAAFSGAGAAGSSVPTTREHRASAFLDEARTKPIYTERHTAFYQSDKLLRSKNDYFDLQGKKIAELNSDYTRSLMMPTYVFRDLRTGSTEGLRWQNGKYYIFRQARGEREELSELEDVQGVFSCQGWHYYLVKNLDRIGKADVEMKLIFPSSLDFYDFRIRLLGKRQQQVDLRLEFDSWIIRLFAPHLDLTYDTATKKLVRFFGPSNILDQNGDVQNVYIFYD